MALGASLTHPGDRPTFWRGTKAPPLLAAPAARAQASGCTGLYTQTCVCAQPTPQLRHPPAPSRHRHPHRARATRPQRCVHHHDLHPRAQSGSGWHCQPAGHLVSCTLANHYQIYSCSRNKKEGYSPLLLVNGSSKAQCRIKWSNALSAALEPSLAAITICL